jgi:ATP-dependent helicase HrpA
MPDVAARRGRPAVQAQLRRPALSEQKQAQVMAKEHVTLYGLPISKDRRWPGADRSAAAREVFIVHALVRGTSTPPRAPFMAHNRAGARRGAALRDKARQGDMIADENALFAFFEQRSRPRRLQRQDVRGVARAGRGKDPRMLFLSLADVLLGDARAVAGALPGQLVCDGAPCR